MDEPFRWPLDRGRFPAHFVISYGWRQTAFYTPVVAKKCVIATIRFGRAARGFLGIAAFRTQTRADDLDPDRDGEPCPECGVPFGTAPDPLAPTCRYCGPPRAGHVRLRLRLEAARHEVRCGECRVTWRSWWQRIVGNPKGMTP